MKSLILGFVLLNANLVLANCSVTLDNSLFDNKQGNTTASRIISKTKDKNLDIQFNLENNEYMISRSDWDLSPYTKIDSAGNTYSEYVSHLALFKNGYLFALTHDSSSLVETENEMIQILEGLECAKTKATLCRELESEKEEVKCLRDFLNTEYGV